MATVDGLLAVLRMGPPQLHNNDGDDSGMCVMRGLTVVGKVFTEASLPLLVAVAMAILNVACPRRLHDREWWRWRAVVRLRLQIHRGVVWLAQVSRRTVVSRVSAQAVAEGATRMVSSATAGHPATALVTVSHMPQVDEDVVPPSNGDDRGDVGDGEQRRSVPPSPGQQQAQEQPQPQPQQHELHQHKPQSSAGGVDSSGSRAAEGVSADSASTNGLLAVVDANQLPVSSRVIGAAVNLALFAYSTVSVAVLTLLNCVPVPGEAPSARFLHLDATLQCGGWQTPLYAGLVVLLLLPLAVARAASWSRRTLVSATPDELRCLMVTPSTLRRRRRSDSSATHARFGPRHTAESVVGRAIDSSIAGGVSNRYLQRRSAGDAVTAAAGPTEDRSRSVGSPGASVALGAMAPTVYVGGGSDGVVVIPGVSSSSSSAAPRGRDAALLLPSRGVVEWVSSPLSLQVQQVQHAETSLSSQYSHAPSQSHRHRQHAPPHQDCRRDGCRACGPRRPLVWAAGVYRSVCGSYRGDAYMWESVLVCQRLLLSVLATFASNAPVVRTVVATVVCALSLCAHVWVRPMRYHATQLLQTVLLFCLLVVALVYVPPAVEAELAAPDGVVGSAGDRGVNARWSDAVTQDMHLVFGLVVPAVAIAVAVLAIRT
jgi:hypothetical protein